MKTYSLEEKGQVLKEVKETGNALIVAKRHKIPISTLKTWLKNIENKDIRSSRKTLKDLEKKLADKDLEISILKDLLKKTNQAWLRN